MSLAISPTQSIATSWKAFLGSHKFTPVLKGMDVIAADGQSRPLKAIRTHRYERPLGLRFSQYAYRTEVIFGKTTATGWGEASSKLLATQKSLAEAIERAVFYETLGGLHHSQTTNGWACHINKEKCHQGALEELLERDAVLAHWLCERPMTEIYAQEYPAWLSTWVREELSLSPYSLLRIFVSDSGYLPSVTTAFQNGSNNAVFSHATDTTLDGAIMKALAETCRLTQLAVEGHYKDECKSLLDSVPVRRIAPECHAMLYAYYLELPAWMGGGRRINWFDARNEWNSRVIQFEQGHFEHEFIEVLSSPLVVGYCRSDLVQDLYFGSTSNANSIGLLNKQRLRKISKSDLLNLNPHIVA